MRNSSSLFPVVRSGLGQATGRQSFSLCCRQRAERGFAAVRKPWEDARRSRRNEWSLGGQQFHITNRHATGGGLTIGLLTAGESIAFVRSVNNVHRLRRLALNADAGRWIQTSPE